VARCLAKKPGERFQTMGEVLGALERAEARSRTLRARVQSSWRRLGRVQRLTLAAGIGLVVAGAAGGTGMLGRGRWLRRQARSVKNARMIAFLRLEDRAGTPASKVLAGGMKFDLYQQLMLVPGLRLLQQNVGGGPYTEQDLVRLGAGTYVSGWVAYDG